MSAKVLVVGSGGREHALVWKLAQSEDIDKLYAAPGNAGTEEIAENIPIEATDLRALADFAKENHIDLTVVGPELPLTLGIVDHFQARGLRIFGPRKAAAQIENSKVFAKRLMEQQKIPTAPFRTFSTNDSAKEYIKEHKVPLVIKRDGLAGGKGTSVCKTKEQARVALQKIFNAAQESGKEEEIIIESFIGGQELSIHAFCNGDNVVLLPPMQDYKTLYDGDEGPMTGGMGAIAPVPWVSDEMMQQIGNRMVKPVLKELETQGRQFVGCLYPGLKIDPNGNPYVLEFNARLGDPETQCLVRLLSSDPLELFQACVDGGIGEARIEFTHHFAACIVLAAQGYPENPRLGDLIYDQEAAEQIPEVIVFHAGTAREHGLLYSTSGRVLNVTALGETLHEALDRAYQAAEIISFRGKHYRKDIGKEALAHTLK